jgi:hypothetical protein
MNMTIARRRPSPKTVCVPRFQRSQALQSAAAARKAGNVSLSGKNSSADFDEDLRGMFLTGGGLAKINRVNGE